MPSCSVPGCKNRTKKGVKIYMTRFPKDAKEKEVWLNNLNRENWKPTAHSTICQVHFEPEMWERERVDGTKRLKRNAVPTIFPKNSKKKISSDLKSVRVTVFEDSIVDEDVSTSLIDAQHSNDNDLEMPEPPDPLDISHLSAGMTHGMTEVEMLRLQLDESNSKLKMAEQKLQTANKLLIRYKRLQKTNMILYKKNKDLLKEKSKLTIGIKKMLNDDQIRATSLKSTNGFLWSNETINKALRLRFSCGSSGYEELKNQNIPLPSLRTLRRKLKTIIDFPEGISDEMLDFLKQKVSQFKDEKDCMVALDEMA